MSEEYLDWGDIAFDQSTISDLTNKDEDPLDLQTQLIALLTSNDPLNEGVFAKDIALEKTGPLVTGENLFANMRNDNDDEDEAQLHAMLTGALSNVKKVSNEKSFQKKSTISTTTSSTPSNENESQLPAFLQEQCDQFENIKLTDIGLGSLELASLHQQYKLNAFSASTGHAINRNNDNNLLATTTNNLASFGGFGFRTDTGFIIASREELLHKMRTIVLNISELCYLSEPEAESLLRFYQWDVHKLQNEWVSNTNEARLHAGIWRHVDSTCYLFGIGCLSSFLLDSALFRSRSPSSSPSTESSFAQKKPGDITSTQFIAGNESSSLFSWNELISQVFQYYQTLFFERTSSKKISKLPQFKKDPQIQLDHIPTIGDEEEADTLLILPDATDQSLVSMHSSSVANEFRGSFKFIGNKSHHSNSHGLNFPGLTSELTYESTAAQKMRSNSISFSRLDLPVQLLYFTHAKTEFSQLLYTLVKCFHFPQEINLTEELQKIQSNFTQFLDSTKSLTSPLSGLQNTSEFYSIELQEQLHGLRQVLQTQDKCCPHTGMITSSTSISAPFLPTNTPKMHNNHKSCGNDHRPLLTSQRILDSQDVPPLTTSFSLVTHHTLESMVASLSSETNISTHLTTSSAPATHSISLHTFPEQPNPNSINNISQTKQLDHLYSEQFFKNIIIPLDNLLLSFVNPTINISPDNISQSLNGNSTPYSSFIFSYLQQHMWFSEQNQIAAAMYALCPQSGAATLNDKDDPFGLKALEAAAGADRETTNLNTLLHPHQDTFDDEHNTPDELQPYATLMHPRQIPLWNDLLVDESEVVQISPFVFNLPHHSLSETKFYLKTVDFKLLYSLLAYQNIKIDAITNPKRLFTQHAPLTAALLFGLDADDNLSMIEEARASGVDVDENDHSPNFFWFDPITGESVSNYPQLEEIFELFRQTDYYAKFSAYRQHRDSLLPPGKQFGNVHIPSFFQPTLYVQCSTAYCNIIRLDNAFALGCGHYFCKDCWTTNLRHCLTEQGREAALIECMGGEYHIQKQQQHQTQQLPSTTTTATTIDVMGDEMDGFEQGLNLQPTIDAMTSSITTLTLHLNSHLSSTSAATPIIPLPPRSKIPSGTPTITPTTSTTTPSPATPSSLLQRKTTLQNKLKDLLNRGKNDGDEECTSLTPVRHQAPNIATLHPMYQYRIVGKCHSVIPMSFLFRIISPTYVPASASPAISSPLNPIISPNEVLDAALSSHRALSMITSQYFITAARHQADSLAHSSSQIITRDPANTSIIPPSLTSPPNDISEPHLSHQLSQNSLTLNSSGTSQRSFKFVQQGSSSFFTKQDNGMVVNNQSLSNIFATNPSGLSANSSLSMHRAGSSQHNNNGTHQASEGLLLPTQPLDLHASQTSAEPTRPSLLEQPSLVERNSTMVLSRSNTLQLPENLGSSGVHTHASGGSSFIINAISLFPAPLHNQSSLRRLEIDRLHDSTILQQAQLDDDRGVIIKQSSLNQHSSVTHSHLALLAAAQHSKRGSTTNSTSNDDAAKYTTLTVATSPSSTSKSDGSNPNKLHVAHIQELSPNNAYLSHIQANTTVFAPRLSPSIQYNKLLWWILDIFVDKSPAIKWCPNPLCNSYRSFSSNSSSSDTNQLADETMPMKPTPKTKFEVEIEKAEKAETDKLEKAPYAIIFIPAFQHSNNPTYHVDCLCEKSFCFRCLDEPHSPSPCDLYKRWKSATGDKSNEIWLNAKTKACPKCHVLIEKNKACNHMTCTCRHQFCWLCLQDWSGHSSSFSCSTFAQQEKKNVYGTVEEKVRLNASLLTKLEYYVERFKQHTQGIDFCVYLQKAISIALPRASNFVLNQIIQRSNSPNKVETASPSTAQLATEDQQKKVRQYVSVRFQSACKSVQDSRLNIFNLDTTTTIKALNGQIASQSGGTQYTKWISDADSLPYYYSNFTDLSNAEITRKQRAALSATSFSISRRSEISNEGQYPDLHPKFDFLYTALDTLIKTRKVLQYAFIVAYYLKTTTNVKFTEGLFKPTQSKSQKQLFELQLRYLVEPTEKLQSYIDHITEDLTYVFSHKRVILELCTAIDKLRKFLLQHVSTDQNFEEALLYEADIDMTRDIWICSCSTEHPLSISWCSVCVECRIHREPECKICGKNY